jgi:high-affinity iron transporter
MASRRWLLIPAVGAVVGLVATATVGAIGSTAATRPLSWLRVAVTQHHCALNWLAPSPVPVAITVTNQSTGRATVTLFRPATEHIMISVALRHGASARRTLQMKPGGYQWSCRLASGTILLSEADRVGLDPIPGTPHAPGPPGVTRSEITPAINEYRRYATAQLEAVRTDVTALAAAIAAGSLSSARHQWLVASVAWDQLGGAYGTLGTLGQRTDEPASGLPYGVADPHFVGFHKVEYDLWQTKSITKAAADTTVLAGLLRRLTTALPHDAIPPTALPIRAHEILEDALRDDLSGDDDDGSGTELAAVVAGVAATEQLLRILAPLLAPRAPGLEARADRQLDLIDAAIDATGAPPAWTSLSQLSMLERERIDATVSAALETLSDVPYRLRLGGDTT